MTMRVKELAAFIIARHSIAIARDQGMQKPWTDDPILQGYRFCNVYRELDTVTRWISANWREPNNDDPDLWFAMSVARWINWPETLIYIGYPLPWRPAEVIKRIKRRQAKGAKVWTGAYMIGTQGNAVDKPKFIVEQVLGRAYANRNTIRPHAGDTLQSFAGRLMSQYAFKGFMAGQVIADLKYAKGSPLANAADWHTWAASGPGSRRGLNRVMIRPVDQNWKEEEWHAALLSLQTVVNALLPKTWAPLHAQDLQNCLCEFDKYERVRRGEGRPRSLYNGRE